MKTCKVCGAPLSGKQRSFCSYRCAGLARQHYKTCKICGKPFPCPPSDGVFTCSPECSKELRRRKAEESQRKEVLGKARKEYVEATPPEQWQTAKDWVLQAPDGKVYECRNLIEFFRQNTDLIDGTPRQAASGICVVKGTMMGTRKKHLTYHWKGWRLLSWDDRGVAPRGKK